jgi:uncharacterized integral membrane protein
VFPSLADKYRPFVKGIKMKFRTIALKYGSGAVLASLAVNAFAAAPDFTSLTTAVDYSTAIAAILLVAAGLAGVGIVMAGIKLILPMIKGRA